MKKVFIFIFMITLTSPVVFSETTDKDKTDFQTVTEKFKSGNYKEALNGYENLAKSGNLDAQLYLSILYSHGITFGMPSNEDINKNIPYDEKLALKWLREAANQNAVDALYYLGVIYNEGKLGIKKNDEEALKLFMKSSKKGEPRALYNIGNFYRLGRANLDVDYKKAIEYYKGAEKIANIFGGHHAKALYNIGFIYYHGGNGVKKSFSQAHHYFSETSKYADDKSLVEKSLIAMLALCKENAHQKECQ